MISLDYHFGLESGGFHCFPSLVLGVFKGKEKKIRALEIEVRERERGRQSSASGDCGKERGIDDERGRRRRRNKRNFSLFCK